MWTTLTNRPTPILLLLPTGSTSSSSSPAIAAPSWASLRRARCTSGLVLCVVTAVYCVFGKRKKNVLILQCHCGLCRPSHLDESHQDDAGKENGVEPAERAAGWDPPEPREPLPLHLCVPCGEGAGLRRKSSNVPPLWPCHLPGIPSQDC